MLLYSGQLQDAILSQDTAQLEVLFLSAYLYYIYLYYLYLYLYIYFYFSLDYFVIPVLMLSV